MIPEHFRQYHLTKILRKKYSHTTYLASLTNEPEHQVVLIMFTSSLFHLPRERELWLAHAEYIKQLQYPHLLPLLDMGIEEEQPFAVREYLPHSSLRDRLKQVTSHRLELQEALALVSEIGQVLVYAHEHNSIHGNIKPENILFDANGHALLTDFSLANRRDALIRDQAAEEYAFCYIAPEQFSGTCDAKSDQYALGCLAYELITGQVPFAAQNLATMLGYHNNARPVPLSEKVTGLLPSLEAAVLKALAKDPAQRFADCSLFLEIIQSTLPLASAFPITGPTRSRKHNTSTRLAMAKEEANGQISPIRGRAAKRLARQATERAALKQPEQFTAFSEVEVERAESEVTLFTPDASSPEWAGIVPPSEDLASSLQLTSPLSGETNCVDKRAHEENVADLVFLDPFITAEEDIQSTMVDLDVEYKNNDHTEKVVPLVLTSSKDIYAPHPKQPLHNRRRLERAIFLFVIIGLLAYSFWSSIMNITPKTNLHRADTKKQLINSSITSVSITLTSMQATLTQTPQTSTTTIPTTYPSVSVTSAPTLIVMPIPTPTSTPIPRISYEAESSQNTWTGTAEPVSCSGCSGGYRVCCLSTQSNGQNGTLQFNNVNKSIAGSYTMSIYYTEGDSGSRTGYVSVNSGPAIAYTGVCTGSWDTVETVNMTISLSAGNNTIKFFNPEGPGPDIDRIVV